MFHHTYMKPSTLILESSCLWWLASTPKLLFRIFQFDFKLSDLISGNIALSLTYQHENTRLLTWNTRLPLYPLTSSIDFSFSGYHRLSQLPWPSLTYSHQWSYFGSDIFPVRSLKNKLFIYFVVCFKITLQVIDVLGNFYIHKL